MKPFHPLRALALATALLGTGMAGCTTTPDVGPFVDSSAALHSAMVSTGNSVAFELEVNELSDRSKAFTQAWATSIEATEALVAYAESLEQIVSSGQQGKQSVEKLTDAASSLAGAAGIVLPATGIVGLASDTAALVYGHIAQARAAKSLQEALADMQPAVDAIAAHIAGNLSDADAILQTASTLHIQNMERDRQTELGFRLALIKERRKLYGRDPASLSQNDRKRLQELDEMIDATDSWYRPLQDEINTARVRLMEGRRLIAAAADATSQWAITHRQLLAALQAKRQVDTLALMDSVGEIRELISRMRDL